jgi:hypothetical protein
MMSLTTCWRCVDRFQRVHDTCLTPFKSSSDANIAIVTDEDLNLLCRVNICALSPSYITHLRFDKGSYT